MISPTRIPRLALRSLTGHFVLSARPPFSSLSEMRTMPAYLLCVVGNAYYARLPAVRGRKCVLRPVSSLQASEMLGTPLPFTAALEMRGNPCFQGAKLGCLDIKYFVFVETKKQHMEMQQLHGRAVAQEAQAGIRAGLRWRERRSENQCLSVGRLGSTTSAWLGPEARALQEFSREKFRVVDSVRQRKR